MPLVLPNLDDRHWADLVEEGRALIPVYGPEWTDHNVHDPGITVMELLAWIAEMDIYQLNQILDRHKRKFLELIGVTPEPPCAARIVISIALVDGAQPLPLPVGLEFAGDDLAGVETRFRILEPTTVVAGSVAGIQSKDATGFHDLSVAWLRGDPLQPFGTSPAPGAEFYIGLKAALPVDVPVRLYFTFADGHSGWDERKRLQQEACEQQKECHPPQENPCQKSRVASVTTVRGEVPAHHGVRTVWEFLAATSIGTQWVALDASQNHVEDQTRAFTLNGQVVFMVPSAMALKNVGAVPTPWYYLRCRFSAGAYDAPPVLGAIAFNGVVAEQAVPASATFVIARGATIAYSSSGPPKPGDTTSLQFQLDSERKIVSLNFGGGQAGDPEFFIRDYQPPSANSAGVLNLEAVLLGIGTGEPEQRFMLSELVAQQSGFSLYTSENGSWREWTLQQDFDSSTWADFAYRLDPTSGEVTFGTGAKSNVPAWDSGIFVEYRATRAEQGNVGRGIVNRLADSTRNRALLHDLSASPDGWTKVNKQIASIRNAQAAVGGAAAETVAHAAGRAITLVETTGRAVTLADYEHLATETPGTRIARVAARADLHPNFPCFQAPGMITVIILPYLPARKPIPSPGLKLAVTKYLRRRRVIGTRAEVVGPTYIKVAVKATVQAAAKVSKSALQQRIVDALNKFLDPLAGGPDGTGWPFGRDVYHAEMMQVIDPVAGVDHIVSLELMAESCQPQCGNVCLGPTWLVDAGAHQIQVV
jgi:hypothetical protein